MIVEYRGLSGHPIDKWGTHQWHTVDTKDDPASNLWLVRSICSRCEQWFRSCWPDDTECPATLRLTPVQPDSHHHRMRTIH